MKKILLGQKVEIGLSDLSDGDLRTVGKFGAELTKVEENREKFLSKVGLRKSDSILVMIDYDRDDFCRYAVADENWRGVGMISRNSDLKTYDSIATKTKNLGLFLPLADCLGAVIFDPEHEVLLVAHLGRHATEQFGAKNSVKFLREKFGSRPENLRIWLSPAAGKTNYPLWKFDDKSLYEVNIGQFINAGVFRENITGEEIDTTTNLNYFSHSAGDKTKRFAIVAEII